jgi:hypothetical protein
METHVKVFGVLQIVLGALGLLFAAALSVVFTGAASIVGASGDPDVAVALPLIGITGTALIVFVVLLSLPGIVVGIGLVRFQPWARIGGIVLAIFDLVWIPFGTIIGVYGLWVLFSGATEPLFARRPSGAI